MTNEQPTAESKRDSEGGASPVEYQLLDFGDGKKYERLGDYRIVRPSPAADATRPSMSWDRVDASFARSSKRWNVRRPFPQNSRVHTDEFSMPVSLRPSGHLGVFFEQSPNWDWLAKTATAIATKASAENEPRAINLFGYTGASSIAIARQGIPVIHVDASKPTVQEAKRAAAEAGVEDRIKFWVDDALKVLRREARRGRRYDLLVMDPPAYGHAPDGTAWRLERDLPPLLSAAKEVVNEDFAMLVTGHSEGFGVAEAKAAVSQAWSSSAPNRLCFRGRRMHLESSVGRRLDCGFQLRVTTEKFERAVRRNDAREDPTT